MRALLASLVVVCMAVAGCSGGGGSKNPPQVILPDEITEQDIERLGNLAAKFPTAFTFPGQAVLEPLFHWINGSLEPGTGSTGTELPTDDGPIDYGGDIIVFDVADKVPVGQPVEVRIHLKWFGDPGRAADVDIWVDMPGERGAVDSGRFDESNNWNIGGKVRVVNSIHLDGQPFAVGMQVNNGRILDPTGSVEYQMLVEFHFVKDVLPPGAPYALRVPANSTILVVDTERVFGDEHVDVDFVIVGPNDEVIRSMHHNDIGQETLAISIPGGGEYVVYSPKMHGGFLRFESQVPNEAFEARPLERVLQEVVLHAGPDPAPGTYAEQSQASSNTFGAEGTFEVTVPPLDIIPFVRTDAPADIALNVTAPDGWHTTLFACGRQSVVVSTAPFCGYYGDERGRVGGNAITRYDRTTLDKGTYSFGAVANGGGVALGVTIVTFTR